MKIISKLKNFINNEQDVSKTIKMLNGSIIETQKETIMLSDIRLRGIVKHSDGRKTTLLSAKINITENGNTIIFDNYRYVAFEIPEGISVQQALDRDILKALYENGALENIIPDTYNSLGEAYEHNGKWEIKPSSNAVVQNINELNSEIEEKKRQEKIESEEARTNEELSRKKEDEQVMQKINLERQQRIQNPQFFEQNNTIYKEVQKGYSTVNMQTGQEINLRNVEKIGKDPNTGMYLYSAKMLVGEGNEYAMRLIKDAGVEILFATAMKLDVIAQNNNKADIVNIANLLSVDIDKLNAEEKNYIGQLDKNGIISRDIKDTSTIISDNVKKLQEEFRRKREEWNR